MIKALNIFGGDFSASVSSPIRATAALAMMLQRKRLCAFVFAGVAMLLTLFALRASPAHAQLVIDVTVGAGRQIPIAIVPFVNEAGAPQNITPVIGNNLSRTGLFKLINTTGLTQLPSEASEVNFADWLGKGSEAVVIGTMIPQPDGKFEVRFRLFDVAKQTQLSSFSYTVTASQLRATAHKISDEIYEKLLGERGVFSTKIAYVLKRGSRFELQVADADGFNPQTVLSSLEPIRSPKWSPDGTKLAYVSFETRKSTVVVQDLSTGQRRTVANFRGDNYAPNWSPDGSKLVIALSKDSVSQIYTIPATGGEPFRVTTSNAIDTNATFTADGQSIIFVSDRSGGPQLYRVPASGGSPQRISFEGGYNVNPRISRDGKMVAFVNRESGRLRIATMDLASGVINILTEGPLDDSPSFAPNGRTILYESKAGGRGTLGAVSVDGRVKSKLTSQSGDVREPAWGPFGSSSVAGGGGKPIR
jgi:TolB protein